MASGTRTVKIKFDGSAAGLTAAAAKARAELKALERQTNDSSSKFDKFGQTLGNVSSSLLRGVSSFARLSVGGLAAVGAAGTLAQTLVGLSGVLGLLPGAAAAGIAVFGALKLGSDGAKRAFQQLTPTLDKLKANVSSSLESSILPAVGDLKKLLPQLTDGFQQVASAAGGFAGKITTALGKPATAADLKAILEDTARLLKNLGSAAAPFVEVLVHIGRIGLDALLPLAGNLGSAAERMRDFVLSAQGTQKIKDWISGSIGKFKDLGGAAEYILGKLDDLWKIAKPLFDALAPLIQPVVDVLIQVAEALGSAITPAVAVLTPILKDIVTQLGDALVSALQQLAPMLPGLVTALGLVLRAITPLVTQIGLPTLIQLVRAFITGLIAITPAALVFLAAITPLIGATGAFIALLTGNVPAAASIMQNSLTASGQIMAVATQTDWGSMLTTVNSSLLGMQNSTSTGMGGVASAVTGGGVAARSGLGSAFGGMFGDTRIGVGNIIGAVNGGQPGMASAGSGLGGSVSSAIRGLDWGGIGFDIVRGVINGILSYPGSLIHNAAVSVANTISSAFKSALSIGSPSKVMAAEVGRWIPAGIGQGILKYQDTATNPVVNLTKDIAVSANVGYLTGQRGPDSVTGTTSSTATPPASAGSDGAQTTIPLTLDLGEGIQQVVEIKLNRDKRATVRAVTSGAGASR